MARDSSYRPAGKEQKPHFLNRGGAPSQRRAPYQRPVLRRRPGPRVRPIPLLTMMLVILAAVLPYLGSVDADLLPYDADRASRYGEGAAAGPPGDSSGAGSTPNAFAKGSAGGTAYRPLSALSLALHGAVSGDSDRAAARGYHLLNLLIHAAVSVLVLLVLRRLFIYGPLPAVAAVLYATHPVHTDAVIGVPGRPHLLAALFMLTAWLLHLARRPRTRNSPDNAPPSSSSGAPGLAGGLIPEIAIPLSMGAFLLALLSHEIAVALLPAILLGDLHRDGGWTIPEIGKAGGTGRGRAGRGRSPSPALLRLLAGLPWWAYGGLVAVFGFYLYLRRQTLGAVIPGSGMPGNGDPGAGIPFIDNPSAWADPAIRLMTAMKALGKYIALEAYPVLLSSDYSFNQITLVDDVDDMYFQTALLLCLGLAAAGLILWRRVVFRPAALGVLFFLCAILAVSNIPFPAETIFAERVLYLPSMGFCLFMAWLLSRLAGDLSSSLARSTGTPRRPKKLSGFEKDDNSAVAGRRPSYRLLLLLLLLAAGLYGVRTVYRVGDWHDAYSLSTSAAQVCPDSARVRCTRGALLLGRGQNAAAHEELARAVEIYPDYGLAHYLLGLARLELGDLDGARATLERATVLDPDRIDAWAALAEVQYRLDDAPGAADSLRRALVLSPDNPELMAGLGRALGRAGRHEEALAVFRAYVAARPEDAEGYFNLAATHRMLGNTGEATLLLGRALELDPDHLPSLTAMADIHQLAGNTEEAQRLRERVAALQAGTDRAGMNRTGADRAKAGRAATDG